MNILFTLCGRAGSKGVRGKNMREFNGVPLVWLSMAAISAYIKRYGSDGDRIDAALSTDSDLLIDLTSRVKDLELLVVRRDPALAGDTVRKVDVIRDCLDRAQAHHGVAYDMVVDLDLTSPLRTVDDVRRAIERKAARKDADVVFSVVPSRRNPMFNMVTERDGFFGVAIPSPFACRQQAPAYYDINGSIYAYSPDALRHKDPAKFFHTACDVIIMEDTGVVDIDSEHDYQLMQVIAQHLYATSPALAEPYQIALGWL